VTRRALGFVFLAALAVRLGLWLSILPFRNSYYRPDSGEYVALARNLARHGAFSTQEREPRLPDASRTPGYPVFLAAHGFFSESPRWPALTQVVMDAVTAALSALCAAELFPAAPAWAAGLAYGLEPVAAAHSPLILTETLFTFLLVLALYALLRCGREGRLAAALGWGAALGAAALTRPIGVYLWIPWSAAMWFVWGRRRPRRLLMCALAAALLPALWCGRNLAVFGRFAYTTMNGVNSLFWEASAITAAVERTSGDAALRRVMEGFSAAHPGPFAEPFQESGLRVRYSLGIMRAHPLETLRIHAVSAVKMLIGPGLDLVAEEIFPGETMPRVQAQACPAAGVGTLALLRQKRGLWPVFLYTMALLIVCYALAALGLWSVWRGRDVFAAAACLTPLAYLIMISAGGWSYYRFRVPLWPFVAVLVPAGLRLLAERRQR